MKRRRPAQQPEPAPAATTKRRRAAGAASSFPADLIERARAAMAHAACKHSKYRVGACLATTAGQLYTGVNVESDSFGLTICAERVALFKALSEGERDFARLACATKDGGPSCGGCRQLLREYCPAAMPVVFVSETAIVRETTVGAMLPDAFVLAS